MTDPNWITRPELAALIGAKSASYINELEKTGRAIRAPDGKHWLKAESLAAYRAWRDPSKQGVADRHAANRAASTPAPVPVAESETEDTSQPVTDDDPRLLGMYNFQDSKAKREHFAAAREEDAFRKECSELSEKGEVQASYARAGTIVRNQLESWQTSLAPQLVGRDESAIRAVLADHVEQVLREMVDVFGRIASEAA